MWLFHPLAVLDLGLSHFMNSSMKSNPFTTLFIIFSVVHTKGLFTLEARRCELSWEISANGRLRNREAHKMSLYIRNFHKTKEEKMTWTTFFFLRGTKSAHFLRPLEFMSGPPKILSFGIVILYMWIKLIIFNNIQISINASFLLINCINFNWILLTFSMDIQYSFRIIFRHFTCKKIVNFQKINYRCIQNQLRISRFKSCTNYTKAYRDRF